jgi:hypothetical protein
VLFLVFAIGVFSECKNKEIKEDNSSPLEEIGTASKFDSIPYILLPVDDLNKKLDSLNIVDLESIAKVYYLPEMMGEGNESYTIYAESIKIPPRVTILHDNIADDSQRGLKFTILINDSQRVTEIRKSVRCWPGRGRGYWHGGTCL